jgi:hypothetical protein
VGVPAGVGEDWDAEEEEAGRPPFRLGSSRQEGAAEQVAEVAVPSSEDWDAEEEEGPRRLPFVCPDALGWAPPRDIPRGEASKHQCGTCKGYLPAWKLRVRWAAAICRYCGVEMHKSDTRHLRRCPGLPCTIEEYWGNRCLCSLLNFTTQ